MDWQTTHITLLINECPRRAKLILVCYTRVDVHNAYYRVGKVGGKIMKTLITIVEPIGFYLKLK